MNYQLCSYCSVFLRTCCTMLGIFRWLKIILVCILGAFWAILWNGYFLPFLHFVYFWFVELTSSAVRYWTFSSGSFWAPSWSWLLPISCFNSDNWVGSYRNFSIGHLYFFVFVRKMRILCTFYVSPLLCCCCKAAASALSIFSFLLIFQQQTAVVGSFWLCNCLTIAFNYYWF